MRKRIGCISIFVLIISLVVSCSPSKSMIAAEIYETQSVCTIPPTYTYFPTYTLPPTTVQEITRIIAVTETETPSSMFSATMTPTKTLPMILTSGSGILKAFINKASIPMSYFDLDTGKNEDDKTSDIEFFVSCGSGCFPTVGPVNGAISFIFGKKEPSYDDCAENMFSEQYELSYKYLCFKTNSNNISMVKIIMYCYSNQDGSDTMTFIFKTWKQSGN